MKAATAQQHEPERRRKMNKVLRAARTLFLKKGYRQTTMRDICRAARLSNGTVYFYFKNKDAIYAHVYEECFQLLIDMLDGSITPAMPPFEQIETILKTYLHYFNEHREKWEMLDISYRRLSLPHNLIRRFDGMVEQAFSFVHRAVQTYLEAKGLAQRYDSLELALLLFTSIDGLFYDFKQGFFEDILEKTHLTLEGLVERQISIFKQAL
jgi:AcrR family transcriptional regulator